MQRVLVCIIMVTWMVIGCGTTSQNGCYGFWEDNRWGLKRGTIQGKNTDYVSPYRQCVDKEVPHKNLEKRRHG